MAAMSAMLGVGGAFGLVVTGFLMPAGASYHRVFWLSTVASDRRDRGGRLAVKCRAVRAESTPESTGSARSPWRPGLCSADAGRQPGRPGLDLARGPRPPQRWARRSCCAWWSRSKRVAQPLVPTAMLTRRPILLSPTRPRFPRRHGPVLLVPGHDRLRPRPRAASGTGSDATIPQASLLFLMPGALSAAATTPDRRGVHRDASVPGPVVAGGGLVGVVGFLMLAGWQ